MLSYTTLSLITIHISVSGHFYDIFISQGRLGSAETCLRFGWMCKHHKIMFRIYSWVRYWKNFENGLTFGEVIGKLFCLCKWNANTFNGSTYATVLLLLYCVLFLVAIRAENFIIGLTNTSPGVTKPTLYRGGTVCGQYPGTPPPRTVSMYCDANIRTMFRYVYVLLPTKHGLLTFCELEVFVKGMSMMLTARGTGYKCI